ncbi:hypothetical protein N7495_000750 [Penicillium taxi]|uniref:uncharacterized protein n=1 Tax=Penicillium taxi TaxID=168475 RepID=UPI002544EA35|nr:uncharacterized protein N7495_000750 [Penicillium taxi]KAJ5908068.1 hypothetical protein N7495_000750 [Penicillium taxi]
MTAEAAQERLVAQRRNRPLAPHLEIYKWEYVSVTSAMHRITGVMLAGGLYTFATLYLIAPALGLHLESAPMAEAFGSLPLVVKTALKFGVSFPFTYHGFNGLKHLVYDTGHLMSKTNSGRASYIVLACSVSASLGLALYKF